MESRERNSINYNNNPPQSNQDSSRRLSTKRNETLNHLLFNNYHGSFKLQTEKLEPQRSSKNQPPATPVVRYRECLKNHAANMGSHVLDGCGEYMPSGEDETLEALKCAACECHRSFHRREVEGESRPSHHIHHMAPPPRAAAVNIPPSSQQQRYHQRALPPIMMAFGGSNGAAAESSSEDFSVFQLMRHETSKKRFRTKFSQEQKDKMFDFAEGIGWKIQKPNEEDVMRFCNQVGLKKKVFKVWMHNNKQVAKKK